MENGRLNVKLSSRTVLKLAKTGCFDGIKELKSHVGLTVFDGFLKNGF